MKFLILNGIVPADSSFRRERIYIQLDSGVFEGFQPFAIALACCQAPTTYPLNRNKKLKVSSI